MKIHVIFHSIQHLSPYATIADKLIVIKVIKNELPLEKISTSWDRLALVFQASPTSGVYVEVRKIPDNT